MRNGNSPVLVVVIIFVIAAVVGGFYFLNSNSQSTTVLPTPNSAMTDDKMMDKEDKTAEEGSTMENGSSKYVMYDKAGYEEIKDIKHVLFFYANWCPTCRPVDTEFQNKTSEIPEGVTIVRVNYNDTDTDPDEEVLAEEHGITYQHTFVLIENGQQIKKWNGGGIAELATEVN